MDAVFKLSPITLALIAFSASAQETETIEVTGHQLKGVDAVITSDDLTKRQASDLDDIFRDTPEVSIGGSAGISQKVYVRGLEDTMLNVSIDGATQSSSLFHHQSRLSVEPELLKQVEVSAGAGRATNGPGALGGAIQFKTKDAHDLLQAGEKFGALVKAGYYTNTSGQKYSGSLYGEISDGLGLLATYGYVNNDNIKDADGTEQPYTANEQHVGLIKLSGNLNRHHYISLAYDYRQDNETRLNKPHFMPFSRNVPLEQEADRNTVTANYLFSDSNLINLDFTAYTTRNRIAHLDNPRWGTSDGNIDTFGGKIFNTAQFASHSLIIGAEYRDDESTFDTDWDNIVHKEKGEVYGLFIQDDWQVTDALLLSAGARYDWYKLTDNIDQHFESSGFSPNVLVNVEIITGINVFTSYAEAFRGQTPKELFLIDHRYNAPDRGPERARNLELGLNVELTSFNAGITMFNTKIQDVVDTNENRQFDNVGDLRTKGLSAYVAKDFGDLTTRLSYSQARPELNGEPLSDGDMNIGTSIGDTWVLSLDYAASQNLEFGWTSTFVERLDDVAEGYLEKAGYGVHDLYAQWLPITNEDLVLTLSVKNVLDKQYVSHGTYHGSTEYGFYGYAAPGRDFRFNLSYAF